MVNCHFRTQIRCPAGAQPTPPQKTHFPTPPKPAILAARPRAACSFASSIHPLPSAAPASPVLLHLGFGKNKAAKGAASMCFINLHFMHLRGAVANPVHLAAQHFPG